MPDEKRLSKIIDFSVQGKNLAPGSKRILIIALTPLQEGHLQIMGLKYNFLKTDHRHNLMKPNSMSYLTFKILRPIGSLEVKIENSKKEMIFGEVHRCNLILNNTKNQAIEDLIIHCEEPLFSGWRMKRFGHNAETKKHQDKERYNNLMNGGSPNKKISSRVNVSQETDLLGSETEGENAINPREHYEISLDLRATMIQIQNLCFTVYYRTEGEWRMRCFFIGLDIQSSFRIKCMTECLEPNKRLICIDFLYKCGLAIKWEEVFIDKIYLLSNFWKLVKGSEVLTKREGIFMVYLTVEKDDEIEDQDFLIGLTRKQREVWLKEKNTIEISEGFDDSKLNSLDRFLSHENLELVAEASKDDLCKDFIDLAIVWNIKKEQEENKEIKAWGLHSVTSVSMKSIAALSKTEKREKDVSRVRIYIESEQNIQHNFDSDELCSKNVKVVIDCSNVKSSVKRISFRALEPYETPGEDGKVYVNMDNDNELFNWHSKHESVLTPPFCEMHETELTVIYPKKGVYDLNSFYFKDSDSGEVIESICERGQFIVNVEEGLL